MEDIERQIDTREGCTKHTGRGRTWTAACSRSLSTFAESLSISFEEDPVGPSVQAIKRGEVHSNDHLSNDVYYMGSRCCSRFWAGISRRLADPMTLAADDT